MSSASNVNEDNFITMVPYKCKCMQIVYLDKRFQASISSLFSSFSFLGRDIVVIPVISLLILLSLIAIKMTRKWIFFPRQESSVPGVILCVEQEILTLSDISYIYILLN